MIADKSRIFKVVTIITGVLGSLYILSPFLPVILFAAVIAFAIDPLIKRVRSYRWFGHSSCVYVLVTALFFIITIPFLTVLSKVYSMVLSMDLTGDGRKAAMESFNNYKAQALQFVNGLQQQLGFGKAINVEKMLNDASQQIFGSILQVSTYAVTQIPDLLFSFAIFLVCLFLFMRHSSHIARSFYSSQLMNPAESRQVVRIFKETSYSAVFSSVVTGLIQSVIVSTSAALMLDVDVTFIFIVTFFCSFIPIIGAGPIAFLLALYAWAKGQGGPAMGMVVVSIVTGTIDNVVRVVLMKGAKDELHPVVDLLSVIGGVIVLGLPGLFLGPVIVSATGQIVPLLLGKEEV